MKLIINVSCGDIYCEECEFKYPMGMDEYWCEVFGARLNPIGPTTSQTHRCQACYDVGDEYKELEEKACHYDDLCD